MLPVWWVRFLAFGGYFGGYFGGAASEPPRQWGPCMHQGVLRGALVSGFVMHVLNLVRVRASGPQP